MDRTKDGRRYPLVCELLFKNPEMSVFPVAILVWWVRVDSDGDILHNPPFLSLKAFRTRKIHVNLSCIKKFFRTIHNAAAHTKSILRTKLDSSDFSDTTDLTNRITEFGNKRARTSNRTAVEITHRDDTTKQDVAWCWHNFIFTVHNEVRYGRFGMLCHFFHHTYDV